MVVRNFRVAWVLFYAAVLAQGGAALAQTSSGNTVRLIVPYATGGSTDALGRAVAAAMTTRLGQQVIVDNKPGAGTAVGAEAAARSPADGSVVLLGDNATFAINPSLYPKLPYDPAKDLTPVGLVVRYPLMLVANAAVPANSFKEFLALAKAKPGMFYGSPGIGSVHHLAMEEFRRTAGLDLAHVAYKGAGPAVTDLLGGSIQVMFAGVGSVAPHVKSGKLRALAVSSDARLADWPDVPTIAESGFPGFDGIAWVGLALPAKASPALVARMNTVVQEAINDPGVQKLVASQAGQLTGGKPDEMANYMKKETAKWAVIIKEGNIRPE